MASKQWTPRPCRSCGQWISKELLETKKRLKAKRISEAFESADRVGRHRSVDRKKILELRASGMTIREIANRIPCSTHTVVVALKEERAM